MPAVVTKLSRASSTEYRYSFALRVSERWLLFGIIADLIFVFFVHLFSHDFPRGSGLAVSSEHCGGNTHNGRQSRSVFRSGVCCVLAGLRWRLWRIPRLLILPRTFGFVAAAAFRFQPASAGAFVVSVVHGFISRAGRG
jgi:hypothetical protein